MHPALAAFEPLPLAARLGARARVLFEPLAEVAAHASGARVADLRCGNGVLAALLAVGFPDRQVVGVELDERALDLARAGVGRYPNVELLRGTERWLAQARPHAFDCVVAVSALAHLPPERWEAFLADCRALLAPGARLVLAEPEADASLEARQARFLLALAARLRPGLVLPQPQPRGALRTALQAADFKVIDEHSAGRPGTPPHVLFVAECG